MANPSENVPPPPLLHSKVANPRAANASPRRAISALIVQPRLRDALPIIRALAGCGLEVTVAKTFDEAKKHLVASPEVLVTEIKLAQYNGLHLVLRAKSRRPDTAAIVLSDQPDSVLERDAEALGATFTVKPISERDLIAAVFRMLFSGRKGERAIPIRPPFERREAQRRTNRVAVVSERRIADRRRDLATLLRLVADADRR